MATRQKKPHKNTTHGKSRTPEYLIWRAMKTRCYVQSDTNYPKYGAKGIRVCRKWLKSFAAFLSDMGPRPSDQHSLDRKNNNKDYSPSNCRWATAKQQARNKTNNRKLKYNGKVQSASAWAEEYGMRPHTLLARIDVSGMSVSEALTTPVGAIPRREQTLTLGEKTQTLSAWASEIGISKVCLRKRVRRGWTDRKTLTTPVQK